jgi:class 3 adenylate cyclase
MLRRSLGDKISRYISQPGRKGVLRETTVTVLFCDLREYTSLTEEFLKLEGSSSRTGGMNFLWTAIKSYMGRAAQIIEIHNFGWVDKFIGDAVMAVFGLEISSENDDRSRSAVRALDSVFEIHEYVDTELKNLMINYLKAGSSSPENLLAERVAALNSGFGLDYGKALFGEIGNNKRIDWSVLGNPVNTASRLEAKTRVMPGFVLFTDDFLIKLIRESDLVSVKFEDIIIGEHNSEDLLAILIDNGWKVFSYQIVFLRMVTLKGQTSQRRIYTAIPLANIGENDNGIAQYNNLLSEFYNSSTQPVDSKIEMFSSYKDHSCLKKLERWEDHMNYIIDKLSKGKIQGLWIQDSLITNFAEK